MYKKPGYHLWDFSADDLLTKNVWPECRRYVGKYEKGNSRVCFWKSQKNKIKKGKKEKKGTAPHLQLHFTLLKSLKVH